MGDKLPDSEGPEGGVKRQLEGEPLQEAPSQLSPADDSVVTTVYNGDENGPEPALKRVKLGESELTPRVDARDKVKGIALIKPEYVGFVF
jgi:tRNA-dihydrouridine synthase 3